MNIIFSTPSQRTDIAANITIKIAGFFVCLLVFFFISSRSALLPLGQSDGIF